MKNQRELPHILITGANGQLGNSFASILKASDAVFYLADVIELDITSKTDVEEFIAANKINLVINCAAYTNVNLAERESDKANEINGLAVGNLASACKRNDTFLIHFSTDYIFGGRKMRRRPISEKATPSPLNQYGKSKLMGEEKIVASGCKYLIFRTSWLYSEYGGNFVKKIIELLRSRDEIKVVDDQVGTPTYAVDLAKAVYSIAVKIANKKLELPSLGTIYNYSNLGECSWYDFAKKIQELAPAKWGKGLKQCRILTCKSDEFPGAERPAYSVLSKGKIQNELGIEIPLWEDSLARCMKEIKKIII